MIKTNHFEDNNIRNFVKKKVYAAGISRIEIERAAKRVKLNIYTAKPGMVIGKGGQGIEALKKIRQTDPSANVVMCSAMGQQAMVIESIQCGAKDFIVKPFQADRVLEAVKKAVE